MNLVAGAMFDSIVSQDERHRALAQQGKAYQNQIDSFASVCAMGYAGSFSDMWLEMAAEALCDALASDKPGHLDYLLDADLLPARFPDEEARLVAQALAQAHPAQADSLDRAQAAFLARR